MYLDYHNGRNSLVTERSYSYTTQHSFGGVVPMKSECYFYLSSINLLYVKKNFQLEQRSVLKPVYKNRWDRYFISAVGFYLGVLLLNLLLLLLKTKLKYYF